MSSQFPEPRSEEVAQVAVVVVVFPVVVLCRGEHRSQWARLSRASRQIKHHKASSRHCSPSVNESGEQGSKASVSLLERRVRERTLLQASVRREACPSWAAEPACRRTLSERGAGAAGLGTRVGPDERARRAARRGCGGLGPKMARQLRSTGTTGRQVER